MRATMYGCEMVCFAPMGSAPGPYAFVFTSAGTKRCRGTSRIACSTRGSLTPRAATWRSTISSRRCAKSRSSFLCDVAKDLLERPQKRDRVVMRQVEVQRRDGDEVVLHRLEVGALAGMPRRLARADPVVLSPPRIQSLHERLGVDALAEPRDLHPFERAGGKVDVE